MQPALRSGQACSGLRASVLIRNATILQQVRPRVARVTKGELYHNVPDCREIIFMVKFSTVRKGP